MAIVVKRFKTSRTLSWSLASAGSALIAISWKGYLIGGEFGPAGGHHGDVGGGFLLMAFYARFILFAVLLVGIASLALRSTSPILGTIAGLTAVGPLLVAVGAFEMAVGLISPLIASFLCYGLGAILLVAAGYRMLHLSQKPLPNYPRDPSP